MLRSPLTEPLLPELVLEPPRLQLWRAPTDNDGLPLIPDKPFGPLERWLELGLDRLELRLESVRPRDGGVEVVHRASGGKHGTALGSGGGIAVLCRRSAGHFHAAVGRQRWNIGQRA